ncbi:MAG: hypothetical protein KME13_18525 [Myxacorys californica WJT36-NPBG1]|jgi:hypothetical protein|nr:hypothetical protein [Myxacorys californica WJT36-NPBG1]
MDIPYELSLDFLESKHSDYINSEELNTQLYPLIEGSTVLEKVKGQFLPIRAGEVPEAYTARLKKFTYTNLLSSALLELTSKLAAGSYSISNLPDNDFWKNFRENTSKKKGQSELKLLQRIFREALIYKKVFVQVDKPLAPFIPRNRAEEEALNLNPYTILHNCRDVYDWTEDDTGSLTFIKIRQLVEYRPDPFTKPVPQVIWTIITPELILRYSALVELKNNQIVTLIKDGKIVPVTPKDTYISLDQEPIYHGFSSFPVLKFELPSELYAMNHAYLKAKEYLTIENNRFDAAGMAYIQRIFKPIQETLPNLEIAVKEEETPISSNAHIMKVEEFEFKEMQGSVLTILSTLLADLENQIKDILNLGCISSDKGAVQQSGISKKFDLHSEEMVMRSYGKLLLEFLQDLIQLVASAIGLPSETINSISVTGYESFELDSLDSLLATANELIKVDPYIPQTSKRLFAKSLSSQLAPNASSEEKELVNSEIEALTFELPELSTNPTV